MKLVIALICIPVHTTINNTAKLLNVYVFRYISIFNLNTFNHLFLYTGGQREDKWLAGA